MKYRCTVCDYVYDPEVGDPDNGIEPGTAFDDSAGRLGLPGVRRREGRCSSRSRTDGGLSATAAGRVTGAARRARGARHTSRAAPVAPIRRLRRGVHDPPYPR